MTMQMSTGRDVEVFCRQNCKKCGERKDISDICFSCGVCEDCCNCGDFTVPVCDIDIMCGQLLDIAFPEEAPTLDEAEILTLDKADYRLIGDRQGPCDELREEDVIGVIDDVFDPFPVILIVSPEMEFCSDSDCEDGPFFFSQLCRHCARCKKHCRCAEQRIGAIRM